ncbi:MAG: sugar O-acetyltransferase [Rikenellaceae bacterium]
MKTTPKLIPITAREECVELIHCKKLCQKFNQTKIGKLKKQEKILRKIFGRLGKNPWVEPSFWCDFGSNITIGDNFYANHSLVILDCGEVTIGDNVFLGPQCGIYSASHPMDGKLRREFYEESLPVHIGSDVWIGGGVQILQGVTIGDNCVIGAGSVVTRDIPSGSLAVGNPCRVIRTL